MTEPRLKSELWVQAHLRRCAVEGAYALVVRKGDPDAGAIAVKVYVGAREAKLYVRSRDLDGETIWRNPLVDDDDRDDVVEESKVESWLSKETSIDPDLWIVEIEDREGRAFLD